jgi:hypothetical protein
MRSYRQYRIFIIAGILFSFLYLPLASLAQQSAVAPYKIAAMKAMLFYADKGTFSTDVLAEAPVSPMVPSILWNTHLKPSTEESGSSSSVLVIVEVSGKPSYVKGTRNRIQRNLPAIGWNSKAYRCQRQSAYPYDRNREVHRRFLAAEYRMLSCNALCPYYRTKACFINEESYPIWM